MIEEKCCRPNPHDGYNCTEMWREIWQHGRLIDPNAKNGLIMMASGIGWGVVLALTFWNPLRMKFCPICGPDVPPWCLLTVVDGDQANVILWCPIQLLIFLVRVSTKAILVFCLQLCVVESTRLVACCYIFFIFHHRQGCRHQVRCGDKQRPSRFHILHKFGYFLTAAIQLQYRLMHCCGGLGARKMVAWSHVATFSMPIFHMRRGWNQMAYFKTAPATNCCSASLDFFSAYNKEWIWLYWSRWHDWESL